MRHWREKYPIKYAYANLKHSAEMRHIDFELTLAEFTKFCEENESYLQNRGSSQGQMNVHRIKHWIGYRADNITVLDAIENRRKAYWEKSDKALRLHPDLPLLESNIPF